MVSTGLCCTLDARASVSSQAGNADYFGMLCGTALCQDLTGLIFRDSVGTGMSSGSGGQEFYVDLKDPLVLHGAGQARLEW